MNQGEQTVKTQNQKMGQKGAAAVEFGIILPLLVLLVFGTIEFGVMFYNKQVLTNATREGARAGITGMIDDADVQQIVRDYCNGKLKNLNGSNDLQVAGDVVVTPEVNPDGTQDLSVAASFYYKPLFSKIIGFSNITIVASTTMRMEPGSGS